MQQTLFDFITNVPVELGPNSANQAKVFGGGSSPVEAGWVEKPEEYVYSSAKNYAGEMGLIEVELIL